MIRVNYFTKCSGERSVVVCCRVQFVFNMTKRKKRSDHRMVGTSCYICKTRLHERLREYCGREGGQIVRFRQPGLCYYVC